MECPHLSLGGTVAEWDARGVREVISKVTAGVTSGGDCYKCSGTRLGQMLDGCHGYKTTFFI